MTPKQKEWVDKASYIQLLDRWRNAPIGDSIFIDDIENYYQEAMKKKRISDEEHTKASKQIGWDTEAIEGSFKKTRYLSPRGHEVTIIRTTEDTITLMVYDNPSDPHEWTTTRQNFEKNYKVIQ